jgi:hypothetical protein
MVFVSDRTRRGILARVRRIAILLALIALFGDITVARPSLPFRAGVIPDPNRTRDSSPSLAELRRNSFPAKSNLFLAKSKSIPCSFPAAVDEFSLLG